MIIDGVLDVFFGAVAVVAGVLPTWTLDLSALSTVGSYLGLVANMVDLAAWATVAGVMITWEVGSWGVLAVLKLWRHIKW